MQVKSTTEENASPPGARAIPPLENAMPDASRSSRAIAVFALGAVIFAVSYSQAPLYYSNQNQYFLHGLAEGGRGLLHEDWLANTKDPTPLFSAVVAFTYRYLHEALFYVYYGLILGIYFLSLLGIGELCFKTKPTPVMLCSLAAALTLVHSAAIRWATYRLLELDYPWYLQAGVAGQYALGSMFQPSVFGVLLILSIYLFLREKPYPAIVASSISGVVHSTYLLPAAILTLAYMIVLAREKKSKSALAMGALALAIVLPSVLFSWSAFGPSSPEVFAQSQEVLARFRIPHHTNVYQWFDAVAACQLLWIVLAIALTRGSHLSALMLICSMLAVLLTGVQMATGNDTLALLFPWRVTIFLVPIATTINFSRCLDFLAERLPVRSEPVAWALNCVVLGSVFAGAIAIMASGQAFRPNSAELPLLDYIRDHKQPGDVYLHPVKLPKSPAPRGAVTGEFRPPVEATGPNAPLIPIEFQRVRLYTGAPIFIDFKAIPYKDVEVLEWRNRVDLAGKFYQQLYSDRPEIVRELLERYRITHVVTTADRQVQCRFLKCIYEDEYYRLYRVDQPNAHSRSEFGLPEPDPKKDGHHRAS